MAWNPSKLEPSDAWDGGWYADLAKGVNQPFVDAADQLAPNAGIGDLWNSGWGGFGNFAQDPFDSSTRAEDEAGKAALEKMIGVYEGLDVPQLQDLSLESQKYLGDYDPALMEGPGLLSAARVNAPEKLTAQTVRALPDVRYEDAQLSPTVRAERAALERMGRSAFEDIDSDPALRDAQMGSIGKLDEIIAGGGLTMRDRANLERLRGETAAADRGRRDAILQNMAARGMGGSGMELLASLQSAQAATDRDAMAGLETAAQAEERALQAIMQKGELAGSLRGQDFDEAARIAAAHDAIEQFNAAAANQNAQFNAGQGNQVALTEANRADTMNRFNTGNRLQTSLANRDYATNVAMNNAGRTDEANRFNIGNQLNVALDQAGRTDAANRFNIGNELDVAKTNMGAVNAAGMAGWGARQDIANANTGIKNQQTTYNTVDKPKAKFDMEAAKAGGLGSAYGKEADFWTAAGDRKAAKSGALLGGATTLGAGAMAAYAASDERTKTDVEDISDADLDEFFAAMKPKSFRYKERYAEGDTGGKAGFMMQDVEGTKLGQLIGREGPDGMRAYDQQALQGIILAALKKIADEEG